jgi:uncharacterized protein YjbI with pentapeptide repeats
MMALTYPPGFRLSAPNPTSDHFFPDCPAPPSVPWLTVGGMPWQQLSDLPFARALSPHPGGLERSEAYDCAHFDAADLTDADGTGSTFLECAFTKVTLAGAALRRAEFTDVWVADSSVMSTSLAQAVLRDVTFTGTVLAGVEIFASTLRRVTFDRCKLTGVNFRDATLADVTFDGCVLREVDFGSARISRASFPGSKLTATTMTKVTLEKVDLRGAELGLTVDPLSLAGAIITTAQLIDLAPLLAQSIGIVVRDD